MDCCMEEKSKFIATSENSKTALGLDVFQIWCDDGHRSVLYSFFFFCCVPSYISGVHHFGWDFAYVTVFLIQR